MDYYKIKGNKKNVSKLVLGGCFGEQDDELSYSLLDNFVLLGGTAIDTANAYANGLSEKLIGKWFKQRNNRENIFLIDKGCHPTDDKPTEKRVNQAEIKNDIITSLDRLQTSYIDLFLLHRDDESIPVECIIDCLNNEVESGRIISFGASNWTTKRIDEANNYAEKNKLIGFCASSCGFSLGKINEPMWPGVVYVDKESEAWYKSKNIPLIPWSSQAKGWFSGCYISGKRFDPDVMRVYQNKENVDRYERAIVLAKSKGVTPLQISLAYVGSQEFTTMPLIGPETIDELKESVIAINIKLTKEEIDFLEGSYNERM